MDSLLYAGIGDDDDDDESEEEEEEEQELEDKVAAKPAAVDFSALERAGYKTSTDLRQTETYQKLTQKEEEEREEKKLAAEREAAAEKAAQEAREKEESILLNRKEIDKKLGYEKRYDRTKEDFRAKEKRKREMGQQASGSDWVQEEKRRLRHGETGNYDS